MHIHGVKFSPRAADRWKELPPDVQVGIGDKMKYVRRCLKNGQVPVGARATYRGQGKHRFDLTIGETQYVFIYVFDSERRKLQIAFLGDAEEIFRREEPPRQRDILVRLRGIHR
jgi:mRNA-degrading endonuclease RelE of RelBE toxin-antitoxin system